MSDATPYQFFEDLPEAEFAELVEDIRSHGVRVPIEFDETGATLDGHQRLRAVKALADEGVKVDYPSQVCKFKTEEEKRIHVRAVNLLRRQVTKKQRKAHAVAMRADGATLEATAAAAGVAPNTVRAWTEGAALQNCKAEGKDGKKYPARYKPRKRTTVQCKTATETNRAVAALAGLADDETPTGTVDVKRAEKAARTARAETANELQALTATDVTLPKSCTIEVADIYDGLPGVGDCTVDAIITDPPYGEQAIPLYRALGAVASRVLKPGAPCLVLTGQMHLPAVLQALTETLDYRWTLAYLTPGGQSPQIWPHKVNTFWKPLLWLAKAPAGQMAEWRGDVIKTPVNDNDKRFHGWGQNIAGFTDIVLRFTQQQDVILDPFVGGGTTGAAAVVQNRSFIGFDSDPASVNIARARIGGINA